MEPLDEHSTKLGQKMREVQVDVTKNQARPNIEQAYVDKTLPTYSADLDRPPSLHDNL